MAYVNFLVAASEVDVLKLSRDASYVIEATLVVAVSHLIGYWLEVQPLGKLLGQAVDGGLTLNPELWHPLRAPVYHDSEKVQTLNQQITDEWQRVLAENPVPEDDWYRLEIEKILQLFRHASDRAECVVSILESPADQERGSKVRIPFKLRVG